MILGTSIKVEGKKELAPHKLSSDPHRSMAPVPIHRPDTRSKLIKKKKKKPIRHKGIEKDLYCPHASTQGTTHAHKHTNVDTH